MSVKWKITLGIIGSVLVVTPSAVALAQPQAASCALIAHEALHAEIHHRVGHWYRLTQIPTWFDEGLAMQVDFRGRYMWSLQPAAGGSGTVKQWISRSQFFSGDDEELTRHYAMAKEEVRLWLQELRRENVYGFLERVRQGDRFVEIYEE
jgi:hypothetical protein